MTVGEIARLAGLTVRTLHHYDEIGLLVPGGRSDAGYRLYGPGDVERLQEVLFFRELGFALDEIRTIVGEPGYDRTSALRRQRELLETKTERLFDMLDAIDIALESERMGLPMSSEEMLEVFGGFDPADHEAEVLERWGDTEAYRESAMRTADYTKADWERLGAEANAINQALIELMESGVPASGEEAMDLAERHRTHISRWFYECTSEIHAALGRMYVEDQRFTDNIDRAAPGLARYLSEAIAANAGR